MFRYSANRNSLATMLGLVLLGLLLVIASGALLRGCAVDTNLGQGLPKIAQNRYLETGDLKGIEKRGDLRILLLNQSAENQYLPRAGSMLDFELRTATDFAEQMQLNPVVVYIQNKDDLIPSLIQGRGDLIAANLAIEEDLKSQITFTVPLMHQQHVVLTRSTDDDLRSPKDLTGRVLAVKRQSPYWSTALRLSEEYPGLRFHTIPEKISEVEQLEWLADGKIDLAIYDESAYEVGGELTDKLRVAFPIAAPQPIAWGLRPDATELKESLDRYINQEQLIRTKKVRHHDDLDGIKKRRVLRVVTRNNAASYYLWRGELLGFEYEMVSEFARQHRLRLEVLVAPEWSHIIPMVARGEADIAAAFLTPSDSRRAEGVEFSIPYHQASELVITRASDISLNGSEDLSKRIFYVRQSSSYWQSLLDLQPEQGFKLRPVPEDEETETIIGKVASGHYDLTLASSNILDIELTWRDDVKAVFPMGDPVDHSWAVRKQNKKLLAAIDQFHRQQHRSAFYNLTYEKYFKSEHQIRQHKFERVDLNPEGSFSEYDEIIKRYADIYGFDWRLLVAQMYQESRFDPQAKSWAGAKGLMQVLPKTANEFGIKEDLTDPEIGIRAGVQYLAWMRERFEPELPVKDRMWFTLAGYNAGAGHVRDARRLARQKGWDGDRWFGNVERAILLLSKREYARKAQHGYVRGREPVGYVRQIKQRYDAYTRLTDPNLQAAAATPANN